MKSTILWYSVCIGFACNGALTAQQTAQFQPRAAAQSAETASRGSGSVSKDLLSIYERTQLAQDESSLTEIARACAKIIPDSNRSRVDRDYASNLFAWALNRRGEMRGEQAAKLVEEGKVDQASTLDQQAAKDFETAIQYNSQNWRIHHNLAISLAMRGDYLKAIKEFSASIELKDDYPNSHFNQAELYFELAQYAQAVDGYTRAIALNSSDAQYLNSRGHSLFMLESYEAALKDYIRATELGSDSAAYFTDLADAYQYLGRWEDAAQAYRSAVAINSKFPRAYQNAAWLMATCPDPKIRNVDLAVSAAKKAIELSGERSSHALDTLAAATAAIGKHNDAATLQRQALQLASKDEKDELAQRLKLYESGQSYVQSEVATAVARQSNSPPNRIRTASGQRGESR